MSYLVGAHILVVEDEYFIAQELQRALEMAGARVVGPVGNLSAALALIEAERIDGAVLDLNLHGVVDFGMAAELTRRAIPFVFATGYERASVPPTYEHIPIWQKPFTVSEVVASLGRSMH